MATLWMRGKDSLKNGLIAGGIAGALVYWGAQIKTFALLNIPSNLLFGDISVLIYLVLTGMLVGYIIDRF